MQDRGLDLTQHESQPLTSRIVRFADLILTMTRSHRDAIVSQWPEAEPRVQVISQGTDISDPIGGPLELYRRCAEQIDACLESWVGKLPLGKGSPPATTKPASGKRKK
jgi:protein-tyrosine-phosphatase